MFCNVLQCSAMFCRVRTLHFSIIAYQVLSGDINSYMTIPTYLYLFISISNTILIMFSFLKIVYRDFRVPPIVLVSICIQGGKKSDTLNPQIPEQTNIV